MNTYARTYTNLTTGPEPILVKVPSDLTLNFKQILRE